MDVPHPLPRRSTKGNAFASDSNEHGSLAEESLQNTMFQVVHTAEVHNASVKNGSASSDNSSKVGQKSPRRLRRKSTFSIPKKNSQNSQDSLKNSDDVKVTDFNEKEINILNNETFSERSSSPSSGKIKLIPLLDKSKKKKASGYATETLSDESEPERTFEKPIVLPRTKVPPRTSENDNSSEIEISSRNRDHERLDNTLVEMETGGIISSSDHFSPIPMPFPRKLSSKSTENLNKLKSNKSIPGSPQSYCTSSSLDYKNTSYAPKQRIKKHKKKKKLKESNSEDFQDDMKLADNSKEETKIVEDQMSTIEDKETKISPKPDDFICITIHKCEPLQIKDCKAKPFVKVTIMDKESGKEISDSKGHTIESVVTQSYDYSLRRSSTPQWNEDLIIKETLDILKSPNAVLIISIEDEEKNKILAWCFLKTVASNGAINIGKVLRLQLFKPGRTSRNDTASQVFNWWKSRGNKSYKSTLYISINGIPEKMIMENKDNDPNKDVNMLKSSEKLITENIAQEEDKDLDANWSRLPSLSCKIPNKYLARLSAGPDGCIAIAYSHSGLFLASANKASVCVYTYRGRLYLTLVGHHGLVYSLKWSSSDEYLLSASADFFACVWNISKKIKTPILTVSHPSYVYSCAWLDGNTFATGCFDNDIRIWKLNSSRLYHQISRHKGQINTLLFYDNFLISGDSLGEICIWKWSPEGDLEFERDIIIHEIKGKVINKLSLHPGKKRLLVHTRDSVLRMVDIKTGSVLQWFQGLVNIKLREDSTFCGCGSLVFAWSEDSTLCVWDSNTGAQAAMYPSLIPDSQPGAIDFHPHDHMMAVSAHSTHTPVLSILIFDRFSNGREVGLVPLSTGTSTLSLHSDSSSCHSSDLSIELAPRNKESLLKNILGQKKKNRKETSNRTQSNSTFTDFSRISSGTSRQEELADLVQKEGRLGDIIKRMDRILTTVSNSSSLYTP